MPSVIAMSATYPPVPDPASDPARADAHGLPAPRAVLPEGDGPGYVLTLYVASLTPRSVIAIQSVREVCERHLGGHYSLEIVDIYERPSEAKGDQIVAAPTLIKRLPLPLRRLIGDMADEHRVLVGLDLRPRTDGRPPHA